MSTSTPPDTRPEPTRPGRDVGAPAPWTPFVDELRAFVARRVPARDAEDVAQDVLLRLHENAHTLRRPDRAEAWAYAVARRAIADHYRAREASRETPVGPEADTLRDPSPRRLRGFGRFEGDHDVHEEVLTWLRATAEELPEDYREALLLADFEGRTQREVAELLGLSLSGAKSRVQRARRKLGERIERCCELALGRDGEVVDFRRRQPCGCSACGG